ncbi:MAG: NUDIX domain-containing protein [Deltaproteobacteria bacterium]
MKIKGLEVTVTWGGGTQAGLMRKNIFPAHPLRALKKKGNGDILSLEEPVREATSRALETAHRRKMAALELDVTPPDAAVTFPRRAVAKIIAQEIYRYVNRTAPAARPLRKVALAVPNRKSAAFYEEMAFGYLRHVSTALGCGPFVTTDVIIQVGGGIVLVKRRNPPFGWALPGGFVDPGESLEEAARREIKEETGLTCRELRQFHAYSDPARDPRFHTVTTVFTARATGRPRAASDAADARVFTPEQWKKLPIAFDHAQILADYLRSRKS